MKLKPGDSVKVKKGVMCPNDDSVCMEKWQGRIFDIDGRLIGIRWDSITLKQLPQEYVKNSEDHGEDWAEMYFYSNEVEPAEPRDSEQDVQQASEELESVYSWLGDDEEEKRIYQVVADAEDKMQAWYDNLKNKLSFPFEAEVDEPQDRGPLECGDKVKVQSLVEADALYGVLVNINLGRKRFVFPLCDLKVVDNKSENYILVSDYCVWFANR